MEQAREGSGGSHCAAHGLVMVRVVNQPRQLERLPFLVEGAELGNKPSLTPARDCGDRGEFGAGNRGAGELHTGGFASCPAVVEHPVLSPFTGNPALSLFTGNPVLFPFVFMDITELHGEPEMEAGDWYILKYMDEEGGTVDAVARRNALGEIIVNAKTSASICINFSRELVDEWVKKEFYGEEMD